MGRASPHVRRLAWLPATAASVLIRSGAPRRHELWHELAQDRHVLRAQLRVAKGAPELRRLRRHRLVRALQPGGGGGGRGGGGVRLGLLEPHRRLVRALQPECTVDPHARSAGPCTALLHSTHGQTAAVTAARVLSVLRTRHSDPNDWFHFGGRASPLRAVYLTATACRLNVGPS